MQQKFILGGSSPTGLVAKIQAQLEAIGPRPSPQFLVPVFSSQPTTTVVGVDDNKPFLTVAEVAAMLNRSTKAIYQRIARKQLPGVKRVGRSIFINAKIFKKWFDATQPVLTPEGIRR